ncbi:FxSxx-COOH system tetratricopeptide repeat protein [Allonocardiopsis opalescens]|uniref:FxSxx-COOH system tetratricopeptide repeat protein n=1 Tax=Allonocardiopsis opalescens TaxID=1144618 RepID=UPI0014748E03|nr:FxSxx-COOH system tetratricopeptide repeat protein [Allonocardiopsis opalescens]
MRRDYALHWGREIPVKNPHFTGREHELHQVRESLYSAATAVLSHPPQVLYGTGGVGKTEIAAEYCHRFGGEYDVVWWIRAEQENEIVDSLIKLGRRLELSELDVENQSFSTHVVLDALRRGSPHARWLLVFDNAAEPAVVQKYLPSGQPHGHVIITSRLRHWFRHTQAEGVEVNTFRTEETVELLRKRVPGLAEVTPATPDQAEATATENRRRLDLTTRLAKELDNLPLAADHAAAYLKETGVTPEHYLDLFTKNAHDLLEREVDTKYPHPVVNTWNITRERLSKPAAELFNTLVHFSPEPISSDLFEQRALADRLEEPLAGVVRSELELYQAGRELLGFSLIKLDGQRELMQVHRVVQQVIRGQLAIDDADSERRYLEIVHILLAGSDPQDPDRPENDSRYNLSLPHLEAVRAAHTDNPALRKLIVGQVRRLYLRGDHMRAIRLGEPILSVWRERLGADHLDTLQLAVQLGNAYRPAGRDTDARELNEDTLNRLREHHGEKAQTTLICANSYGADLRNLGQYDGAYELDQWLLPLHVEVFTEDHERTCKSRNNLATDLFALGRYDGSLELHQENFDTRQRRFGRLYPSTLFAQTNIGRALRARGQYSEALIEHRDVTRAWDEMRDVRKHPWRLRAFLDFSISLREAGYLDDARQVGEKVLAEHREFLSDRNVETLSAASSVVNDLRLTGDLAAARALGEKTLEGYERIQDLIGPLSNTAVLVNLAIVLRLQGEPQAARELDERALETFRSVFDSDHPHVLAARANLASDLAAMGETERARDIGTEALRSSREVLGERHPHTLATAANLSLDLRATGRGEAADALLEETLAHYKDTLTLQHPEAKIVQQRGRVNIDLDTIPR